MGELPETLPERVDESGNAVKETYKFSDDETRLLYQEFLMKQDTRVADFLLENKATVNDFVRLECGELVENEPGVDKSD